MSPPIVEFGGHARNRVRRRTQSVMKRLRALMRKRYPDPKVPVGNVRELSETFPHKAKPSELGFRRRLRKARSEERLEEPDPIGRDR